MSSIANCFLSIDLKAFSPQREPIPEYALKPMIQIATEYCEPLSRVGYCDGNIYIKMIDGNWKDDFERGIPYFVRYFAESKCHLEGTVYVSFYAKPQDNFRFVIEATKLVKQFPSWQNDTL